MTQKRLQQTRSSRLVSARLDSGPNFESACGGSTPPGATPSWVIVETRMNTRDPRTTNPCCRAAGAIRTAGGTARARMNARDVPASSPGLARRCIPRCYPGISPALATRRDV